MSTAAAVRFVAYAPGEDEPLGFLPAPISWDVSVFHNNVSALTLKYSNLAAGGEYVSRALVTGLDIGFEVNWDDGTGWHEPFDCRFLRVKNNKNDVADPAKLVNLTCPGYGWMLAKVKNMVSGNRKLKNKDTGDIIRLFWNEYTARHGARTLPIDMSSWTTGTDSAGAAWLKKKTLTFELAADLLTILQGQVDIDHCDYRFDGRQLKLWNPDSQWVDLAGSVRLRLGKEVGEAPADESLEEMIHYLLVRGEKKTKAVLSNTDNTPWGVWEGCINEGGIDSNAEARDAAQKQMDLSSRMRGEYTVTLNLQPGDPLPFKDYRPGDWVSGPDMDGNLQRMRVQQITLSGDGSQVTGSIVLNDLVKASELALSSKLASISNGASQTGGTGMAPDVAIDLRQAAAPTGFTATPSLYLTTAKRWATRLLFEWDAVTTATDGTDLDISSYRVWGISSEETTARVIATVPGTDLSALVDGFGEGTSWSFAVQAVGSTTTEPGAMSAFVSITLPEDTDPPVKTSAPHLESASSIVTASWDGLSATGSAMDPDLSVVRVLAGTVNPPTAVVGVLGAGGTWTGYAPAGTTVYFALQAVDTSGNEGPVSDVVSIVVKSVLDDAGLAQLLALNATIYVQDEEPVDPPAESWWWTKTADPTVLRYTADGVTWEVMATDGSDFIAAPVVVAGVLNAQWIRADNIASDSILARHILAGEITADKVATGLLTALVVAGEVIKTAETGKRVVIDASGITLYDADDTPVTFINTNGESFFTGTVAATSLKVIGQMELTAAGNQMSPGSTLLLNAGIQGPSTGPTVTNFWPSIRLLESDGSPLTDVRAVYRGKGWENTVDYWFALRVNTNNVIIISQHDVTTGAFVARFHCGRSDYVAPYYPYEPYLNSFIVTGWRPLTNLPYVDMIPRRSDTGSLLASANKMTVITYAAEAAATYDVSVLHSYSVINVAWRNYLDGTWTLAGDPLLCSDPADSAGRVIGYRNSSSNRWVFRTVGRGYVWEIQRTVTNSVNASLNTPKGLWAGTADYASMRYLVGEENYYRSTRDSDSTNQVNDGFPMASGTTVSIGHDGANFWTADSSGVVYFHDGEKWADAGALKNYEFGYTYYNPATGTVPSTYESRISPLVTQALKKRARIRVSASGWMSGTPLAEVTHLRFYGAVAGATKYLQGSSATGVIDRTALLTSGSTPPGTTTFPDAVPAVIKSLDGTMAIDALGGVKLVPARFRGYPIAARIDMNGSDTAALTASNYKSIPVKTIRESTGEWTPAFSGDCLTMPYKAWVRIVLHVLFNASTGGNRQIAIWKNPSATTWSSSSTPPTVTRLAESKFGPTTDTASDEVTFEGLVNEGDLIMFVARTTSSVSVGGKAYETWATVTIERILD